MKIAVIMGTRPEIIRLYHTIKKLPDKTIYWTGQNFSPNLSEDIFNDPILKDAYNNVVMLSTKNAQSFCTQFSIMITQLNIQLLQNIPDKVLILGDTNSSLAGALVAKKMGIPLYHMEAGNRCYNPHSPEEINRKLIILREIHRTRGGQKYRVNRKFSTRSTGRFHPGVKTQKYLEFFGENSYIYIILF